MASGLPELPFTIKVWYLVHSAEGTCFEDIPNPASVAELRTAYAVVQQLCDNAAVVFAKAGIRLIVRHIAPRFDDEAFVYDGNEPSGTRLREDDWAPGQSWLNVYFVHRMVEGTAYAITPGAEVGGTGRLGAAVYAESCAVVIGVHTLDTLTLVNLNKVLLQELAHILGLPHLRPTDVGAFILDTLRPFPDDTIPNEDGPILNDQDAEARNPMTSQVLDDEGAALLDAYHWDEYGWTPSQIQRMRLTLVSRSSSWADQLRSLWATSNARLPDFAGPCHAWLG